jgi:hypothetical protein
LRNTSLVLLVLLSCIIAGCGITFAGPDEGNDFFTALDVTGDKTAGSPMTAAVAFETFYPVPVDIVCELRQEKSLIGQIGVGQAPAIPGDLTPDDDRVPGNFSFNFTLDEPGDFKVECYTRDDEANFIIEEFTIIAG